MKTMGLNYASRKGVRPIKALLTREQSILAKRHLPRQFKEESNFILVGNQNKKGKFVLISRPKLKPLHVLAKSPSTPSRNLLNSSSPSGVATSTDASTSNKTDATSVTSLQSQSDSEQDSKPSALMVQSGGGFEDEYESNVSHSQSINFTISEDDIIPEENQDKPLILKMGPQDVNVLEENDYLVDLCRKYKSLHGDKNALAAKLIDWVHGLQGNFVVPEKGVFAVASFSTVDSFLQRVIEKATQKKKRPSMPLPMKATKAVKKNPSKIKDTIPRDPVGGSSPQSAGGSVNLRDVGGLIPHDVDVICGRGNSAAFHPGNLSFRRHCWQLREKYRNMPRHEKRDIAQSIVDRVKAEGGRFLEIVNDAYVLASAARALEKAAQALREKKWENRKSSLLGPSYSNPSLPKIEAKVKPGKVPKKDIAKPPKVSKPKNASTAAASSWPEQSISKPSEAESRNEEVEIGSRIEVYWPMDQKYYAAKVKAVNGHYVHLEYELDGVIEWLNLSEHTIRTIP